MYLMVMLILFFQLYLDDKKWVKIKKKELPGQKYFVDDRLRNPLYKDWLKKDPNDLTIARCYVCRKKVYLSTAGQSTISDHVVGKKHRCPQEVPWIF